MRNAFAAFAAVLALACPAFATVTGNPPPASYTCNGSSTVYTIPFPYLAISHISVVAGGVPLALTTNYTVKPAIAPSTGTLTLTTPCANGATLTITRSVPLTQPQSFRTGAYNGPAHEQAFDRTQMQIQQNAATHATDKAAQTVKDAAQDLSISGISNSVAALNAGSHAVTDTSSVLAFGTTTPRTLTTRFADFTMLKDMGAVCNGATDDTAAVNAAIAKGVPVISPSTACKTTGYLGIIPPGSILINGVRAGTLNSAQAATQQVVSKLEKGVEDAFITVVSDSTSYTSNYLTTPNPIRWVSRVATALGAKYPAYTVKFNEWDDVTQAYLGWATVQTGTGTQTLWISNASFSGMSSEYILGTHLAPMLTVTTPDLVMWSHGHNEQGIARSYSWVADTTQVLEEIASAVPNASILVVGQNPRAAPASEPTSQTLRVTRYAEIAARRGYGFLNVYQSFIDYGPTWAADLMNTDGIHPNDAGEQLWADETMRAFTVSRNTPSPSQQRPAFLVASPDQLLVNGNFAEWDIDHPTHWDLFSGPPTVAQDTANFESVNGYAVKLTGAGFISQFIPLKLAAGKCVTVSARIFVAAGQTWFGSMMLRDNTASTSSTYGTNIPNTVAAWRWKSVQRCFAANVTQVEFRLYADINFGAGTVTVDRVSAVVGLTPSDVPMSRDSIRYFRVLAEYSNVAADLGLRLIPGLQWTIPISRDSQNDSYPFECHILYSLAGASTTVTFGAGSVNGASMTNLNMQGTIQTGASAFTSAVATGLTLANLNPIVSATPSALGTVFTAHLYGLQEMPAREILTTFQVAVQVANTASTVTIKRGSYCLVKFN